MCSGSCLKSTSWCALVEMEGLYVNMPPGVSVMFRVVTDLCGHNVRQVQQESIYDRNVRADSEGTSKCFKFPCHLSQKNIYNFCVVFFNNQQSSQCVNARQE